MIKILMTISILCSISMIFLTHPLSMGLMLFIQTLCISLTMGMFNLNFWFSYLLFLIMIGGMLVLFAYMTSVASNEKFKYSLKISIMIMMLFMIMIIMMNILDSYISNINNLNLETISKNINFKLSLNKFINFPTNIIMFMMIIYLLITLIAVVKITNILKGPLRQFN